MYIFNYRILKWTILKRRGPISDYIQASEFQIRLNGVVVAWPTGTSITNLNSNNPSENTPDKLIDGLSSTKWMDSNFSTDSSSLTGSSIIIIDTGIGNSIKFDSYRWSTADNFSERDPVGWTLEGSNNGIDYILIDEQSDFATNIFRRTFISDIYPNCSNCESSLITNTCDNNTCQGNKRRLPCNWINILNDQYSIVSGNWSDFNNNWKKREFLKRNSGDENGIICIRDIRTSPNPRDYTDLEK